MRKIKAVLKMRHLEQLRNGFEEGPLFDIVHFVGEAGTAPQYLREVVFDKLFPNSIEESIVGGYDYMVLNVRDLDVDVELKPGEYMIMFDNNTFITVRGFDNVEVVDGKLVLH